MDQSETTSAAGREVFDLYSALAWLDRKAYAPLEPVDQAAFRFLRQFVGDAILLSSGAALASAPPAGQGNGELAGWKLVPVEPTPAMVAATWNDPIDAKGGIESQNTRNKRIYAAMLASAPPAPTPDGRPYDKIREGLEDAIAFARGDASRGRIVHPAPTLESGSNLDEVFVSLNGRIERLTGVALEVLRACDQARTQEVRASFHRGYLGGLGFALGVCDERGATVEHIRSRILANKDAGQ